MEEYASITITGGRKQQDLHLMYLYKDART